MLLFIINVIIISLKSLKFSLKLLFTVININNNIYIINNFDSKKFHVVVIIFEYGNLSNKISAINE